MEEDAHTLQVTIPVFCECKSSLFHTPNFCLSFFSILLEEWNLQACYNLVLHEDTLCAVTHSNALPTEDCLCDDVAENVSGTFVF
jgi:hypothetical protein